MPNPLNTQNAVNWTQIAANVAAAVMLLFAACEFRDTSRAQRLQNSIDVLNQGRDIEQKYMDGASTARDIVAFYYRLFLLREREGLDNEIIAPLDRSLCSMVTDDPRVEEYWKQESGKHRFLEAFVQHVDTIRSRRTCE